jgi:hypothetical protein
MLIFPLYAGFSDAPSVVPVLGQAGFFDRFEVRFNKPKEVIELKFIDPNPDGFDTRRKQANRGRSKSFLRLRMARMAVTCRFPP